MMAQVCYSMQGYQNGLIYGRAVQLAPSENILPFSRMCINANDLLCNKTFWEELIAYFLLI
jgi:hypothetical protein